VDLSAGRQGLVLRAELDVGTGVELECSYGAGDGWTRSRVASMPKERSGRPRLDQSCDWEKYGYDTERELMGGLANLVQGSGKLNCSIPSQSMDCSG